MPEGHMQYVIEHIWIDDDARDAPMTEKILSDLAGIPVLAGRAVERARRSLELESDPLKKGKRILWLKKHKGAFVKPCPGTPRYVCCGLQILHIGQGCPIDCRYCALQAYFNRPVLEVFVNSDDLFRELQSHLQEHSGRFHRLCTGEFTDSLALDPLTGLAAQLVEFFARCTNASLEIKTKTDFIEPLLGLDPGGRVILSFSVNSSRIAATEERRAASLEKRLAAASEAQDRGYRIGLHFDPIVPHPGWEDGYRATIDRIFSTIRPEAIAWISLGVFRYAPPLKEIAGARFGPIAYYHDGFVRGLDGKNRLQADRRIEIFRQLIDRIRIHSPGACIYFCMESPYVWKEALGIPFECDEDLIAYLDRAAGSVSTIPIAQK